MATKNRKLHKASWLGIKIDVWGAIANACDWVAKFATAKKHDFEDEQDSLLEEIAMEDLSDSSNE